MALSFLHSLNNKPVGPAKKHDLVDSLRVFRGKNCDINDQLQIQTSAPQEQMPGTRFNHACNDVVLIQCCNRLMKSQSQPLYQSIKCYKGNIVNINGARTFIKQDLKPSGICSSACLCLWRKWVGIQILESVLKAW